MNITDGRIRLNKSKRAMKRLYNAGYHAWLRENCIQSDEEAWAKLQRPDWIFWQATKRVSKVGKSWLRLFACDCAQRVLAIFEREHAGDRGARQAIEIGRRLAVGLATDKERQAAERAAIKAIDGNVSLAANPAARAAARHAARSAAGAVAEDPGDGPAWQEAIAAAGATAFSLAWDDPKASEAAAAAEAAERAYQADRLKQYLVVSPGRTIRFRR